jgi:hypothetical protein
MSGMRGCVVVAQFAEPTAHGVEEFRGRELIELRGGDLDRQRQAVQRFAKTCNDGASASSSR